MRGLNAPGGWFPNRCLPLTAVREMCPIRSEEEVSFVDAETTSAPHCDAQYLRELLPYAQQRFMDLPNERLLEGSRNEVQ